ncbi:uncharacterized protein LOC119075432 [Bradysia coprophila]|uniref:uncharacterized protein LOC119075432 n=1 Tax=Bradysia coprophila TaxID=38358 RepID=UPI00187DC861|nr:uncharacterized protein LOC119075432 [Bradysia coprophila]
MKGIVLIFFAASLALVEPHGFLRTPLARTSIFRQPSFGAQQPFWWDDTGVWCGNVQQDINFSTCGRCGDAPGNTHANQGGRYDKGIITATYNAGARIRVEAQLDAAHQGFFHLELCAQQTENNNCFQRLPVLASNNQVRDGTACVTMASQTIWAEIQLPAGVRCNRCTLRWTYRTAYPPAPNTCFNPNPAQTFRNCADIRIQ